jgi:hypothetical protein
VESFVRLSGCLVRPERGLVRLRGCLDKDVESFVRLSGCLVRPERGLVRLRGCLDKDVESLLGLKGCLHEDKEGSVLLTEASVVDTPSSRTPTPLLARDKLRQHEGRMRRFGLLGTEPEE